jgi:arsenate reductase-like glutaredoxin family protein
VQPEFVIANKVKIHRDEALTLARQAKQVCVAKGKKWLKYDASDGATDDELCSVILGRSGTLRAPAMRVGEIFVVGFHPEGYAEVFGV